MKPLDLYTDKFLRDLSSQEIITQLQKADFPSGLSIPDVIKIGLKIGEGDLKKKEAFLFFWGNVDDSVRYQVFLEVISHHRKYTAAEEFLVFEKRNFPEMWENLNTRLTNFEISCFITNAPPEIFEEKYATLLQNNKDFIVVREILKEANLRGIMKDEDWEEIIATPGIDLDINLLRTIPKNYLQKLLKENLGRDPSMELLKVSMERSIIKKNDWKKIVKSGNENSLLFFIEESPDTVFKGLCKSINTENIYDINVRMFTSLLKRFQTLLPE